MSYIKIYDSTIHMYKYGHKIVTTLICSTHYRRTSIFAQGYVEFMRNLAFSE